MSKIESFKYNIQEAFSSCYYVVPDYQREYVWTDDEVLLLLDDISEQIDGSDTEYFIGTILVSGVKSERSEYEVVDGQQRLTTLFLLLCALRNWFKGESDQHSMISKILSDSFTNKKGDIVTTSKLAPKYDSAEELLQRIVDTDGNPSEVRAAVTAAKIKQFGSLENLLNAYSSLHRAIGEKFSTSEDLKKFWGYLASSVVFIQISTDVSSALKIFETINERGVGLNPMDLLKNLLFTQVDHNDFSKLKNEWKKITAPLEKKKEKPLRFLRYYIMANYEFKMPRNDSVVREDEIYSWFTNKEHAKKCAYESDPFEFIREVRENVEHYLLFREGKDNKGEESPEMQELKIMTGSAFSLHYILLLAASPFPQSLFNHFVRQLESFLFYYIFSKTPTKQLEKDFSVWADKLRVIAQLSDSEEQENQLDQFVEQYFNVGMAKLEGTLDDALNRYSLVSMQKYRSNYLLAKITQHVQEAFQGVGRPLTDFTSLEIEHILPDNPNDDLRTSFTENNPNTDYDEVKNILGNLTLLEKPHNIVASNDFFANKQDQYANSGNYLTKSIVSLADVGKNTSVTRINARLSSFDEWTIESINSRGDILRSLIADIWKTSNFSKKL